MYSYKATVPHAIVRSRLMYNLSSTDEHKSSRR